MNDVQCTCREGGSVAAIPRLSRDFKIDDVSLYVKLTFLRIIMTTQSVSPLTLPVVTIQPTFTEVIQEVLDGIIPSDKFWVSCYKTSETSVHAKVHVELDEIDRNLVNFSPVEGTSNDDVEVLKASNGVSSFLILILNLHHRVLTLLLFFY